MTLSPVQELAKTKEFSSAIDPKSIEGLSAAVAVAKEFAEAVDIDARFPSEAFAELRAQRLLGLMLPRDAGGEGARVTDVAQIIYALGRVCSSTAMIYAMHQASIACLVRHADSNPKFDSYLRRIGEAQLLLASSTTEGSNGGNLRTSAAAIEWAQGSIRLVRDASVVSYGAAADAIVSTARRSPESIGTDQALVLFFRDDYRLTRKSGWNSLGMRGTCSEGFLLEACGEAEQVLATPYERVHRHTMMPVTHLFWTACWTGVAAGAVERAQNFIRMASRAAKGAPPPGARLATEAALSLMTLRSMVNQSLAEYERRAEERDALDDMSFQASLNMLKVGVSELAIATVMQCLNVAGISGYRNDGEFSIARPLRDILSSAVMVNNARIMSNVATPALLSGVPDRL